MKFEQLHAILSREVWWSYIQTLSVYIAACPTPRPKSLKKINILSFKSAQCPLMDSTVMRQETCENNGGTHDDVIKWKLFPPWRPFLWGIHRSPVNSLHRSQGRGALMFSLIYAWINGWVNNREAGDLRRHHAHYGVTVIIQYKYSVGFWSLISTLQCLRNYISTTVFAGVSYLMLLIGRC